MESYANEILPKWIFYLGWRRAELAKPLNYRLSLPIAHNKVMKNGWVKIHRKLLENPIFNSEKGLKIWIWCLLKANHQDNFCVIGRQKLLIKKGQFIMGGLKAEELLEIARSTIFRWLDFFQKEGMVDIKKTNKYTVITILNWDKYQDDGHQMNIKRTSNEHQKDTNKNVENEKNDKNTSNEQVVAGKDVNNLIDLFKEVNPNYEILFKNKSQRAAIERMVNKWGYEKMENGIKALSKIIGQKFAPTITTPIQLENKMGDLINFIKKERSGNKKIEIV